MAEHYRSRLSRLAAERFLGGEPYADALIQDLAQHIQNAVEEWFAAREADRIVAEAGKANG